MTKKYRLSLVKFDGTRLAWLRSDLDSCLAEADVKWKDVDVKSMQVDDILDGITIKTYRT